MEERRSMIARTLVFCLLAWTAAALAHADESAPQLRAAAAAAERIVIATPELKGSTDDKLDIPPGGRIPIEVKTELRGTGNKSVLVVNSGDPKQYPKYLNGRPYVFLLKRNANGKGWLNTGNAEIPIRNGKVQWLVDGKVVEELPQAEFEELAATSIEAVAEKYPTRDTLTGNWILARMDKGTELYLWLIEIKSAEGQEPKVRILSSNKRIESSSLKSAQISGNDVHLVFAVDETAIDFEGRFHDGLVRGTVVGGLSVTPVPARLEPTDQKSMKKKEDPIPDPLYEEFVKTVSQENPTGALTRFTKRHPLSPLSFNAYQALVGQAVTEKLPQDRFEKLAEEFRGVASKWGPRMELQALVDLGGALSVKDHLPDLALNFLNEAHQRFTAQTSPDIKKTVEIERGRRLIAAGQEAAGLEILNQARAESPFDAPLLYALARQAEKDRRVDDALELYGELQILPLLEQSLTDSLKSVGQKLPVDQYPRRLAAKLWLEKHGDGKGLPEYLDSLYLRQMKSLGSAQPAPATNDGNRAVLCEFFTGIASTNSIAAEAVVSSLQATFGPSKIVVLRYHLHEPSPDPLANADAVERHKMYHGQSTPWLLFNG
ncbi:MAG: hypothetical protein JSS02_19410, partial [Planctomycetes bacterium]|nr:hypothetical protein [Planctomycetota bacterium]